MPAVQETIDRVKLIDVDQYKYGFETIIESDQAPIGLSLLNSSAIASNIASMFRAKERIRNSARMLARMTATAPIIRLHRSRRPRV